MLNVWINPASDPDGRLVAALEKTPGVKKTSKLNARILVTKSDGSWQLTTGDLTPIGSTYGNIKDVAQGLGDWANWYAILNRNPSNDGGIELTLLRDNDHMGTPPPSSVEAGEVLKYIVHNNSDKDLYVTVINMSTTGDISSLYFSDSQKISAGRSLGPMHIGTELPPGSLNESTDYIKVYAGQSPINPAVFTSASLNSRDSHALDSIDWLTDSVSYRLKRSATRAQGYAIILDDPARATSRGNTDRHSVCKPNSITKCIEGELLSDHGDAVFVTPNTRSINTSKLTPGKAFQGAYELGEKYSVKWVEPFFKVSIVDQELETGTRSSGSNNHDPAAAADHVWSLKYVKAPQAKAQLQAMGRAKDAEARGVYIAHLDTGYRKHPEIWAQIGGQRPILPDWGIDLVDNDSDPFDELVDDIFLSNPGHGTSSGSVIVSPDGCQLEGANHPCMTGVGTGAQLIPVRVHTSVVVLDQHKLAQAISAVVDRRIQGDPPLISIAMGGPPSWSLWRAVQRAEDAGIAIIAAAGNNVKTVVWPARFKSTIAVGAVNIRCRPWTGSSMGSAVDISAPGESVWRAGVVTASQKNEIDMGIGTTYATATTTGVAALWLAKNSGSTELAQLRSSGRLTNTLRNELRRSAWQPGVPGAPDNVLCTNNGLWNSGQNGAGIINADALLRRPIPSANVPSRKIAPTSLDDLPLYSSLYPDNAAQNTIRSDYLQLLGSLNLDSIRRYEVELLFHYATNEQVLFTLDKVVNGFSTSSDYQLVRARLLEQDLSKDLRLLLANAQRSNAKISQ